MTNKEIAMYAKRFFAGCSIDDDCMDCIFKNDYCEDIDVETERKFEEFLDKYNHQTVVNQHGKNAVNIENGGDITINL